MIMGTEGRNSELWEKKKQPNPSYLHVWFVFIFEYCHCC